MQPTARSPAAASTTRRAADVAVVGGSLQAYAAAYLLARRGKRTVVVEHPVPQLVAAGVGPRPDVALHLPGTTAHLVNEATEALALWRGIEAASGARSLLHLCGSVDIAPARGSSAASDALGMMQDASRAAGLPFGMLAADEVAASFPLLRLPKGSAALYTNLGGVVNGAVAAAALRAMAQRAGADMAAAAGGSAGRCLLGWRDAGSHFVLRAGPAADAATTAAASTAAAAAAAGSSEGEVIYECEQLLLLPDAAVQHQALALFGMAVPGAGLRRLPAGCWAAQEDCAAVPVWQLLGSGSTRSVDDPAAIDSCWGLPVLDWAPGGMFVSQCLADGEDAALQQAGAAPAQQQQQQQQEGGTDAPPGSSGGGGGGSWGAGLGGIGAAEQLQLAGEPGELAAAVAAAGLDSERPGSEEAIDAQLQRLAELQGQRQVSERRLATAGALAARLIRGVGGPLASQRSMRQHVVTPDGEPAAGSHLGYEAGRVVVAFPAAAAAPGCLPGEQLAPLVARLAVSSLLGQPPEAVDGAAVALDREALQAQAVEQRHDTWSELGLGLASHQQ